jgi:hypothetical protein
MGSGIVIILSPRFDNIPGIPETDKPVGIQAFISESADETLCRQAFLTLSPRLSLT